ncbi:phosphomannomutase [Saccharopolyspora lacisalsi]|uniref:Phosphomannomutase n=1 Tax=Halosaccharopolyspora lacisalsi TaxID=1000566 RepID=A0A839E1U1_9PSEU|nr:phospho-sugar mutase [Halosaccharopolyspora lacisalsi]MBA8826859.1 phosphomannomutase [Halosaccharopolyspora lacisalsi]
MSNTLDPRVRDAAHRWIAEDVDPASRAELQDVLVSATSGSTSAVAELDDRMSGTLTFGTAGLRGAVRAGPNGMNRSVVIRATAGLASWLTGRGRSGGVVVVGRDARHGSTAFAEDTAGVLTAAGFDVRVLPEPLPTPVLAHATRALNAVAGVQITASHNPPGDNGYKVYLRGGVPLLAPADTEIEALIDKAPAADAIPRSESWSFHRSALEEYLDRVSALPTSADRRLRVVATALHGVGAKPLERALNRAGFDDVLLVTSQAEPDPDFPTVEFPNPEEPGTADALLELAAEVDANLAVALDPDADRCALGMADVDGTWRMLRGDETGVLLGEHVLSTTDHQRHPDPLVATTIVSSTMLTAVAAEHRVHYDETLIGFKWLVRAGDGAGTGLVYAYEEALGHCVDPDHVRDKDGISAAVLACDMVCRGKETGRDLAGMLDSLELAHGVHETGQVSVRVIDLSVIAAVMRRLRAEPPEELAGVRVSTEDLLPDSDVLVLRGPTPHGDVRVVVRPSGTEPKLKCYLQVVDNVVEQGSRTELAASRRRARELLEDLRGAVSALVES